jgi:hypothetical protein
MQVHCFLQFHTYIHFVPHVTEARENRDNRSRRQVAPEWKAEGFGTYHAQSPNMTASGQLYVRVADEVCAIEVSAALDRCAATRFWRTAIPRTTLPRLGLRYAKSEFEHIVCMAPYARQQPQCKHHYITLSGLPSCW